MRARGASLLLALLFSAAGQTSRDEGLRAFAAGDYARAAAVLRPLAEDAQPPDHTAAFVTGLLYASGRGVSPNPVAACGLLAAAAATPGSFTEPAAILSAGLRSEMGRAAEFCVGDTWRTLLGPSNMPAGPGGAASAAGPGLVAAAHDDMLEAVRLTRAAGESDWVNDALAQFLMATAYKSGRGVAQDDLRACALYERAAGSSPSPLAEMSRRLMYALWHAHDTAWFNACQGLSQLGLDHRFEPVTFTLGLGYDVAWDFAGATLSYQGSSKRFPLPYASRGAAFLPLIHTTLHTGPAQTRRDFVQMLFWERTGAAWTLTWNLFEVTSTDVRRVAGAPALATRDHRPAADEDPIDPATLVDVRVNELGVAEWAVRDPAHASGGMIESEEDRRAARDEEASRTAALARVDWSRTFDPARMPSLRYALGDGCADFQIAAFSEDRAEAILVAVDRTALGLSTTPATLDLAQVGARASIVVHVFDRPVRTSPFCTDVGQPLPEQVWRAVSGRLTIELSPRGVDRRKPGRYRATIRLEGAQFVDGSGKRVQQQAPIVISALAGAIYG